jgi:hypothetical protein
MFGRIAKPNKDELAASVWVIGFLPFGSDVQNQVGDEDEWREQQQQRHAAAVLVEATEPSVQVDLLFQYESQHQ